MAQIKYHLKNIEISYFGPEQGNILLLKPSKAALKASANKNPKQFKKEFSRQFEMLKKQLETSLNVDSVKSQKDGISIKLNKTQQNVGEYLRSLGASGGEQIEDAASIAQQAAKDSVDGEQSDQIAQGMQSPSPMGQEQIGMPPPTPGAPSMGQQPLMAGKGFGMAFNLIYEATFFQPKKPKKIGKKSARPGRRTGEYWKSLEKVVGKNRQKILPKDVLVIRNKYNKKPKSPDRDKVLRALDRAFNYFHRRTRLDKGPSVAKKYSEDYYALDNLTPSDYSEENRLKIDDDRGSQFDPAAPLNGPQSNNSQPNLIDFSNMFDDDDEDDEEFDDDEEDEDDEDRSYDDIQIDEKTF